MIRIIAGIERPPSAIRAVEPFGPTALEVNAICTGLRT